MGPFDRLFGGGGKGTPDGVIVKDPKDAKAYYGMLAQYFAMREHNRPDLAEFFGTLAANDAAIAAAGPLTFHAVLDPAGKPILKPDGSPKHMPDIGALVARVQKGLEDRKAAPTPQDQALAGAVAKLDPKAKSGAGQYSIDAPEPETGSLAGKLLSALPMLAAAFMEGPMGWIIGIIGTLLMLFTGTGDRIANSIGIGGAGRNSSEAQAIKPQTIVDETGKNRTRQEPPARVSAGSAPPRTMVSADELLIPSSGLPANAKGSLAKPPAQPGVAL